MHYIFNQIIVFNISLRILLNVMENFKVFKGNHVNILIVTGFAIKYIEYLK